MNNSSQPNFWMNETSGVLRPVVEKLLNGKRLLPREIAVMRAYFRQWIESPVWDLNPHQTVEGASRLAELRTSVTDIATMEDISTWLEIADGEGLDPL